MLWVKYLIHTQVMRLFIYAERTGDFDLHLYCVEKMTLICQAAAHIPYAKSTRSNLDTMRALQINHTKRAVQEVQGRRIL